MGCIQWIALCYPEWHWVTFFYPKLFSRTGVNREVNVSDSVYDTKRLLVLVYVWGWNRLNRTNLQKYSLQVTVNVHLIHQIFAFRVIVIKSPCKFFFIFIAWRLCSPIHLQKRTMGQKIITPTFNFCLWVKYWIQPWKRRWNAITAGV